jgi:hypothetical protein
MDQDRRPPKDIPGLITFEQKFGATTYEALMHTDLAKRYNELKANTEAKSFDLANALAHAPKIYRERLDDIIENNVHFSLMASEEYALDERIDLFDPEMKKSTGCQSESSDKRQKDKSLAPERKQSQLCVMAQCCNVVLNIQKSIGQELAVLMQKPDLSTNDNISIGKVSPEKEKARRILKQKFATALEIILMERTSDKSYLPVTVKLEDGRTEEIPLVIRAIDVALELANKMQRCPRRAELIAELESRHRQELIVERDKDNLSPVNWSDQLKQAGLQKLPV